MMRKNTFSVVGLAVAIMLSIAACSSSAEPVSTGESIPAPTPASTPMPSPTPQDEPVVNDSEDIDDRIDLLSWQSQREQEIFEDYNSGTYTFADPYIIQDPYELNPLSALVMFETSPDVFTVTIAGNDNADTVQYDCQVTDSRAVIPIFGLYSGGENVIEIKNSAGDATNISVRTEPLPDIYPTAEIIIADSEQMEEGLTFISSLAQGVYAVDSNGNVRWRISDIDGFGHMGPIFELKNGRLAVLGGVMESPYYAENVYEIDFLGKVYKEYKIPGHNGHHEIRELPSGNLLVASGAEDRSTEEDFIIEIDRETGEVVRRLDLKEVIPMPDYIADPVYVMSRVNGLGESMEEAEVATRKDWFHNNSFYYDEDTNSLILSARNIDGVFKVDYETENLIWVLTDPSSTWAQAEGIKEKLLFPVGDEFEYLYGQHSVQLLPDGDLMVFDNGCYRSKAWDTIIDDRVNYSRAVRLNINEDDLTVEQIWQYGKERGNELLSCFVSNIDVLNPEHYLINFGGIIIDPDGYNTSDNFVGFSGGTNKTVLVEVKDDKVVFEMELNGDITPGTYRAYRMGLYDNNEITQ